MSSLRATHYPRAEFPAGDGVVLDSIEVGINGAIPDAGAGHVTLAWQDPYVNTIEPDDIISVEMVGDGGSAIAKAFIVADIDYGVIDPNEEASQVVIFSGPGTLAVTNDGCIEPPGGPGLQPIVTDIIFDYSHPDYDDSGPDWVSSTVIESVADAQPGGADPWPIEWSESMPDGGGSTKIIGPSDGASDTARVGTWYFRDTFTTTFTGVHFVYVTADNAATVQLDGKPIASVGSVGDVISSGFSGSVIPTPVTLTAGMHTISGEVTNFDPMGGPNPTGIAISIILPGGFPPAPAPVLVWETDGSELVNEYPAETPGMTPGTVIRLALEQHTGRAWADDLLAALTFDDVNDTNSVPWATFAQIAARAGVDTVYTLIQKIAATYADIEIEPDSWALNAYAWGTLNPTSGVTYQVGNLASLHYKRQRKVAKELLILWKGGYSRNGTGDVQGFLELGPENTAEEVGREGDQVRAIYGDPREEIALTTDPTTDGELPWLNANYIPGSVVTAPARTGGTVAERALQIGCSFTKDGERVKVEVSVQDIILQTQQRILNAIKGTR